jgi:hypothetical protein
VLARIQTALSCNRRPCHVAMSQLLKKEFVWLVLA